MDTLKHSHIDAKTWLWFALIMLLCTGLFFALLGLTRIDPSSTTLFNLPWPLRHVMYC